MKKTITVTLIVSLAILIGSFLVIAGGMFLLSLILPFNFSWFWSLVIWIVWAFIKNSLAKQKKERGE